MAEDDPDRIEHKNQDQSRDRHSIGGRHGNIDRWWWPRWLPECLVRICQGGLPSGCEYSTEIRVAARQGPPAYGGQVTWRTVNGQPGTFSRCATPRSSGPG